MEISQHKHKARRGRFETNHGDVQTPCFMPIATKGAVKTLSSSDMKKLGAQILLSNTYHLLLRPGLETMSELGGLHRFMNWDGPILTDSGGYQVFSLSRMNKTTEDGVTFQSHVDGARVALTPELSMQMQTAIGSDIMMQFDDVAAGDSSRGRYEEAMERSVRWAKRCKTEFSSLRAKRSNPKVERIASSVDDILPPRNDEESLLFGIVQGGTHEDLREKSARGLMEIGFDGYAIGGLSVGEKREDAYRIVKQVCEILPQDKPRYFMGGGMPEEIIAYVQMGVDMFDCVLPTRNARHGTLFVWNQDPSTIDFGSRGLPADADQPSPRLRLAGALAGKQPAPDRRLPPSLKLPTSPFGLRGTSRWAGKPAATFYDTLRITNEQYQLDQSPIDPHCNCETCKTTSRAYLRHLFSVQEILALRLATIHNLHFYLTLMRQLREWVGNAR